MSTQSTHNQLLFSRRQSAHALGYTSIDPILELERQGRLTPVRPTGKPTGQVFYRRAQLEAIANAEAE